MDVVLLVVILPAVVAMVFGKDDPDAAREGIRTFMD